jgi:aquaporin Z
MLESIRKHWPEYLMEAAGLGLFMISAGMFGTLLEYPGSPLRQAIQDPLVRRALMGLAMGLTAVAIIYSPWGQQSGAHLNPALTLTFLRLGKIRFWDAMYYSAAQILGGLGGVLLVFVVLGNRFSEAPVSFVVTVPGEYGMGVAFAAELLMCFGLMTMVLITTNQARLSHFTGGFAGLLLFLYITFEAPLSGMSINPARTWASAWPSGIWTGHWVYATAPPLGMLVAAQVYLFFKGRAAIKCCKLNHHTKRRCIHCGAPGNSRDTTGDPGS